MASAVTGVTKRKDTEIWLIGHPISRIEGRKLPSYGDVLRRLFFLMRNDKRNVKDTADIIIQEVAVFWEITRIPIMANYHAASKLGKEYDKWHGLQKVCSPQSVSQIRKQAVLLHN